MAAQIVSLLATAAILWFSVLGRRLMYQPLPSMLGHALFYAVLAWAWSAGIALALFLMLPARESRRMVHSVIATARVAVWFAPACILLAHLSAATLAAALALVISATRLFYAEWMAGSPAAAEAPPLARGMFGENAPPQPAITRELATGIAAAAALQWGVVSIWKHQPLAAGFWIVAGAAIVTLFALVSGAVADSPRPSLPRSFLGVAATILLGATLTAGGLWIARRGHGSGDGLADSAPPGAAASAREVLRELFGDKDTGKSAQKPVLPEPAVTGIAPDGTFPGVILTPEVRPVTRIVAPLPRAGGSGLAPARSYAIPFDGRYLLYQFPQIRPPVTSILERGSPTAMAFRTVARTPLNMDAIQRFDVPVDFACCSRLRVEVWNADRYPGTVSLEVLADLRSLGGLPVRSQPDLQKDPVPAVPESLDFAIPPGIAPVTELKVVFHRARVRADKSARVAIKRFVLLP